MFKINNKDTRTTTLHSYNFFHSYSFFIHIFVSIRTLFHSNCFFYSSSLSNNSGISTILPEKNKGKYKLAWDGSGHSELFLKLGVPKNRHRVLEKYMWRKPFFSKVAGHRYTTLPKMKSILHRRVSSILIILWVSFLDVSHSFQEIRGSTTISCHRTNRVDKQL